ncbi:hypothetical protein CHS0354_007594 [Potamilus streckersoni]|uniref:Death domain-containing protein n=1 Tax=Potamilus streckersoni TaxID=2493646 RepID=A0AAE0T4X2_9BIVA|nr:hypothetical protein CHS0354_007594 [Potamilus streckersoni]
MGLRASIERSSKMEPQSSRSKEDNNDLSALLREDNKSLSEALGMVHILMGIIQDKTKDLRTKDAHIHAMHDKLEEKLKQFKNKSYIDGDIVYQIEMKLYDLMNKAGDLSIRSGTPGLDVSGELAKLRNLTMGIRSELMDVGLLLDYYQEREVTGNEDISVLTLLDEPRFSVFLPKTDRKKLRQKCASAKCVENFNMDNIFKESKLRLSNIEDDEYTLQSDVFQIKQFRLSQDALCKVEIFNCERISSEEWAAIVQIDGIWVELPVIAKKNHAHFDAKGIDTVYIISRPKCTRVTLTKKGWTFQSDEDQNIKVEFPDDAVKDDTPISLKVLTEQVGYITRNEEVDEFEVYDVSPCVSVDHKGVEKFTKNVKVSLTLPETSVHPDTFVILLNWTHDDEIELLEQNIEIRAGVGIAEVDSFSRKMFARVKKGHVQNFPSCKNHVKRQVSSRFGVRTYCQLLIFVDTAERNTLWVEVVSTNKVEDVLNKRKKDNPSLFEMNNSRSGEICLADRQGVRIYVEGKLRFIPHHMDYMDGCAVLTFRKKRMDNHIRFPLEPNPKGSRDTFTFMNFKTYTYRNTAKMRSLHRYHFSELDSFTVKERKAPRDNEGKDPRKNIAPSILSGDVDFFSERSLRVLAENIPVTKNEPLGIELGIKINEIDNFKAEGHTGINLTFRILQQWMKFKRLKSVWDRITVLCNALADLNLLAVASVVDEVFKEKRELQRGDFSR